MIRIKRITSLDVLAETIPKPKGAVPMFGLPKWKTMPLENKIPMVPGPKNAYNLARRKVGKKLWTEEPRIEFDLNDPYCYKTKFLYDPLHDKHLSEFFSKPNNIKRLLKADLITNNMDVKCSLRDYNAFRQYLKNIHIDDIQRELKKRNRRSIEERTIYYAEDQARKQAKKLKEKERFVSARQRNIQQLVLQEELKRQKQQETARETAQRLKLLNFTKQEERRIDSINRMVRAEQVQQRRKIATNSVPPRIILRDWKRKHKARMKDRERRFINIEQHKQKIIEEKWKRKEDFQDADIMKKKKLLQHINTRRQQFIKNYSDKINKETARMQRLSDNARLFTRCYLKRHLPDGKKRICCKRYSPRNMNAKKDEMKSTTRNLKHRSLKLMKQGKQKALS